MALNHDPEPGSVGRIAVLRALPGLGDLLCAVPALRAVRAAHPDAVVTLVGLRAATWLPIVYPELVDDVLVIDAWPGLPETRGSALEASRFLTRARARRFDLALQLHGSGNASNLLLGVLGARCNVGSRPTHGPVPPPGRFITYEERGHEIHRLLRVTCAAGAPSRGTAIGWSSSPLELPRPLTRPLRAGALFVVLHPGASIEARRHDPRLFTEVGRALAARGVRPVVTGSGDERDLTRLVAHAVGPAAIDLGGLTDLQQLAAVVGAAIGVVTNDTGVSHLAAALEVPSVVLFSVSDARRWAPLDRRRHVVVRSVPTPPDAGSVVGALDAARATPVRAVPASAAATSATTGTRASG